MWCLLISYLEGKNNKNMMQPAAAGQQGRAVSFSFVSSRPSLHHEPREEPANPTPGVVCGMNEVPRRGDYMYIARTGASFFRLLSFASGCCLVFARQIHVIFSEGGLLPRAGDVVPSSVSHLVEKNRDGW